MIDPHISSMAGFCINIALIDHLEQRFVAMNQLDSENIMFHSFE